MSGFFMSMLGGSKFDWTTTAGKKIVIDGDSITFEARWTTPLCAAVGATQINQGINSRLLQSGESCGFPTFNISGLSIPFYDNTYGLFILALGVNDIGLNNGTRTPAGYKSTMQSVMNLLTQKNWPLNKIMILSPYFIYGYSAYIGACSTTVAADDSRAAAYRQAALEVAQEKHVYYVNGNLVYGVNPSQYLADGIHPNVAGGLKIRDYLLTEPIILQ